MAAIHTITDLQAYEEKFGEGPQVGHYLVEADRAGAVVEVLDCYTVKVAWQPRKARKSKRARRLARHVTTPKAHGIRWLVAQDTIEAVNAAYAAG